MRKKTISKVKRHKLEFSHISPLFTTHQNKHNQTTVVSEGSRPVKLTYCIWWNSCVDFNFLFQLQLPERAPPKHLSTTLTPQSEEGSTLWSRSPYIKTVHTLWYHMWWRDTVDFLFILTNPEEMISSAVCPTTDTSSPHHTFKLYLIYYNYKLNTKTVYTKFAIFHLA